MWLFKVTHKVVCLNSPLKPTWSLKYLSRSLYFLRAWCIRTMDWICEGQTQKVTWGRPSMLVAEGELCRKSPWPRRHHGPSDTAAGLWTSSSACSPSSEPAQTDATRVSTRRPPRVFMPTLRLTCMLVAAGSLDLRYSMRSFKPFLTR